VGSAPFRGNLRPQTVKRVSNEYSYTHTFTIQSAFKYDNPPDEVTKAIKILQERPQSKPRQVNEEKSLELIKRYTEEYTKQIVLLAPFINIVAKFVPSRRKRKLHIGLFGYSRNIGDLVLPRAIPFTAALYSMGIPPEILGLNALSEKDIEFLDEVYVYFERDLMDALVYYNPDIEFLPKALEDKIKELSLDFQQDEEHKKITDSIVDSIKKNKTEDLTQKILLAAERRKFLG
jgi:phosphoenolpyruvate carboxylase